MSEINSLKNAAKTVMREIARHAHGLAVGLQNAAPPQQEGPPKSVLYLMEISSFLQEQIRLLETPDE